MLLTLTPGSVYILMAIAYRQMGTEISRAAWPTVYAMAHNLRMPNGTYDNFHIYANVDMPSRQYCSVARHI